MYCYIPLFVMETFEVVALCNGGPLRWQTASEKSLPTGAEDGRVAFSLRNRSLRDGKPLRLSREFEHGSPTSTFHIFKW